MKIIPHQEAIDSNLHLSPNGIFKDIEDNDLRALEQAGEWLVADGDMIISDGHEQNYLYVIISGKVDVFKYNLETKKRHTLANLTEGACLGEIALLRGAVASANVKALKKTIFWRIDHSNIQQYIAEYPGGGQLCLNLADTLAQRVQEGNTRLLGVSQSLSAYFGNVTRTAQDKDIDAPQASGLADMEIPREIYDMFVREVYELDDEVEIQDKQRARVDELIRGNEVDFISWLELGQRKHRLKVILKFQPVDEREQPLPVKEPTEDEKTSKPTSAGPQKPKQPSHSGARQHIVRVPQIQARVKARTAVIKEKPNRTWQIIHYSAYALLPFVTILTVLKLIPLDARISIATNETYQAIPLHCVVNKVIFQKSKTTKEINLGEKKVIEINFNTPKPGWFTGNLTLDTPIEKTSTISLQLINITTRTVVYRKQITFAANSQKQEIFMGILPGGQYRMNIKHVNWEKAYPCSIEVQGEH